MNRVELSFIENNEKDSKLELLNHLINIPENLIKTIKMFKNNRIVFDISINYKDIDRIKFSIPFFNDYIKTINKLFPDSVIYKNNRNDWLDVYIYFNLKKEININSLKNFILNNIKCNDNDEEDKFIIADYCNISRIYSSDKKWYDKFIQIGKNYDIIYKRKYSYRVYICEQNKNKNISVDLYMYDDNTSTFIYNINNEFEYIYNFSYLSNNDTELLINKISKQKSYNINKFILKNNYGNMIINTLLTIIKKEIEMKEKYVNIQNYIDNVFKKFIEKEKISWNI